MNKELLLKLKRNPHYKLSPKQKKELEEMGESTIVHFGKPPLHDTKVKTHKVDIIKVSE